MKYQIEILETRAKVVEIEAINEDEAIKIADNKYQEGEFDMSEDSHDDYSIDFI